MKSSETKDITASPAIAIDKAAESVAKMQLTNLKTNLRLSNLEKAVSRQDNKSGETINQLKSPLRKLKKLYRKPLPRAGSFHVTHIGPNSKQTKIHTTQIQ
jgi:hypothetical protein